MRANPVSRTFRWGMICCLTLEWLALGVWVGGGLVLIGAVIPAVFNTFGGQELGVRQQTIPQRDVRDTGLARMIHDASAASADTPLRQAVSPFSSSTYCTSMPQGFTPPSACLASRLHAFATNLHE